MAKARVFSAALIGEGFYLYLWVDGAYHWPDEVLEKRIEVTGVLTTMIDLPVFITKKGEQIPECIPVPKGTDITKANKRLILKNAIWKLKE